MTPMRSLAVALGLGSVLGISCYSEPRPPSTYRFACDADGDCNANEVCRRGRCEVPCSAIEQVTASLLEADLPCPIESGFAACINGACANTCALEGGYCPPDYECLDVGIGGGGGGGGFGGGGSDEPIGVCTLRCDDELCPPAEACDVDGLCKPIECTTEPCPDGLACSLLGTCLPSCADGRACPDGFSCSTVFPGLCEPECTPACGADEQCFFGACAATCEGSSDDCPNPDQQACFFGVCAPKQDEGATGSGGGDDEDTGAPMTDGTGDGATGSGTTGDGATGSGTTGDGTTTGMGAAVPADEERR